MRSFLAKIFGFVLIKTVYVRCMKLKEVTYFTPHNDRYFRDAFKGEL